MYTDIYACSLCYDLFLNMVKHILYMIVAVWAFAVSKILWTFDCLLEAKGDYVLYKIELFLHFRRLHLKKFF